MLTSELEQFQGGWFDSHCHLNEVDHLLSNLNEAEQNGIRNYLVPSTESSMWASVQKLKTVHVQVALGTHPWFVKNASEEAMLLEHAIAVCRPSAIGEVGLDFYPAKTLRPSRELQLSSLELQLNVAQKSQLPVILHCVKAHQELIALLKHYKISAGVVHAFAGSYELAKQYLDLGIKLGVGPALLKSYKLQTTVQKCPMESLLLETDAPFMAIEKRATNPLLDLIAVGEKVAALKKLSDIEVRTTTRENAEGLFFG